MKVVQFFLNFGLWRRHWVDDVGGHGVPSGYKRRYFFILDDMAAPWWAAVELSSGLVQGAILGIRKNDLQVCRIQRILLAVHCLVMVVTAIIIRPCGSHFGNVFLIASKIGSFITALLIAIHSLSGNESAYDDADFVTAGFGFIASLQTAVQLLLALVLSRKSLLALLTSLVRKVRRTKSVATKGDGDGTSLEAMMSVDSPTSFDSERAALLRSLQIGFTGFEGNRAYARRLSASPIPSLLLQQYQVDGEGQEVNDLRFK